MGHFFGTDVQSSDLVTFVTKWRLAVTLGGGLRGFIVWRLYVNWLATLNFCEPGAQRHLVSNSDRFTARPFSASKMRTLRS